MVALYIYMFGYYLSRQLRAWPLGQFQCTPATRIITVVMVFNLLMHYEGVSNAIEILKWRKEKMGRERERREREKEEGAHRLPMLSRLISYVGLVREGHSATITGNWILDCQNTGNRSWYTIQVCRVRLEMCEAGRLTARKAAIAGQRNNQSDKPGMLGFEQTCFEALLLLLCNAAS